MSALSIDPSLRQRVCRVWPALLAALMLLLAACRPEQASPPSTSDPAGQSAPAAVETAGDTVDVAEESGPRIVVAPSLRGSVDEALVREAYERAAEQAERDFGLHPRTPVTVYIDPDSAMGLEHALGLSQKNAIHLRAGRARSLSTLLPLMMHEYTHVLQYQTGRLRPMWWIEGQADHQALRVRPANEAERERRNLYGQLAADVRSGRAPKLVDLRSSVAWDEYVKRAGAGKAYGWGQAAVAFIEETAGFPAVVRIMNDSDGRNTSGRFDELLREITGLGPDEFDAELKRWVTRKAQV